MSNKIIEGGFQYKIINTGQFRKVNIRLKPSKIVKGGVGVFALRNLKKGTIIGEVKFLEEECYLFRKTYNKIDKKSRNVVNDFCIPTKEGFYAPRDLNYLSIPWYLNHSCNGNVGFDNKGNFVTIKEVKGGEELCYDYGLSVSSPFFRMKCKCGNKNCRKLITGNDWKDPNFRKSNYKNMTPELKELINKK